MTLEPDIYLLGSGIYSFLDLTVLTQHILTAKCKTVYFLHELPSFEKYLKKLVPEAQNLLPLYYIDGRDRDQIYDDIVRHVVETENSRRPAALCLHGHPLVYSSISQRLLRACENRGLAIEIVPAVSSLDRMFVDLRLDIGERGVQIFNAASAVLKGIPLNPHVGCFLFQIGSLNNVAARKEPAKPEELRTLKTYLHKFYPKNHVVKIIESAVEVGFTSRVTEIDLSRLETAAENFDYNASMYIPGLETS